MAIKKTKKKKIISGLVKNAFRFIGSTIGIVRDDEVVEGSLPLALYPAHYADNSIINSEAELGDLSIDKCEGDVPMWMRVEHAPNISKRKIKRRIYKNIKQKNRMLKIVKKNQAKADSYRIKLKQDMNTADELYNLRKRYVESLIDNREVSEQLNEKTNELNKAKLLSRIVSEKDSEVVKKDINEFKALDAPKDKKEVKKVNKPKEPKQLTEPKQISEPKPSPIEPNDMIKPKKKIKS